MILKLVAGYPPRKLQFWVVVEITPYETVSVVIANDFANTVSAITTAQSQLAS